MFNWRTSFDQQFVVHGASLRVGPPKWRSETPTGGGFSGVRKKSQCGAAGRSDEDQDGGCVGRDDGAFRQWRVERELGESNPTHQVRIKVNDGLDRRSEEG